MMLIKRIIVVVIFAGFTLQTMDRPETPRTQEARVFLQGHKDFLSACTVLIQEVNNIEKSRRQTEQTEELFCFDRVYNSELLLEAYQGNQVSVIKFLMIRLDVLHTD